MCGRTACTLDPEEVSRASRYRNRHGQRRQPRWRDGDADKYRPSYNKSPQSFSPVLLSQRHFDKVRGHLIVHSSCLCMFCMSISYGSKGTTYDACDNGEILVVPQDASVDECVVAAMRWGLIPSWFREDDPRKMQYSTNNCRSESLLDKKSYKVDILLPHCVMTILVFICLCAIIHYVYHLFC